MSIRFMPQHEVRVTVRQMISHVEELDELTRTRTRSAFDEERLWSLAVVRLLEMLGEAASRVPEECQAGHPEIPWRSISGLRNRLIHGYDQVDYDIVWKVLSEDIPKLKPQLDAMLAELTRD